MKRLLLFLLILACGLGVARAEQKLKMDIKTIGQVVLQDFMSGDTIKTLKVVNDTATISSNTIIKIDRIYFGLPSKQDIKVEVNSCTILKDNIKDYSDETLYMYPNYTYTFYKDTTEFLVIDVKPTGEDPVNSQLKEQIKQLKELIKKQEEEIEKAEAKHIATVIAAILLAVVLLIVAIVALIQKRNINVLKKNAKAMEGDFQKAEEQIAGLRTALGIEKKEEPGKDRTGKDSVPKVFGKMFSCPTLYKERCISTEEILRNIYELKNKKEELEADLAEAKNKAKSLTKDTPAAQRAVQKADKDNARNYDEIMRLLDTNDPQVALAKIKELKEKKSSSENIGADSGQQQEMVDSKWKSIEELLEKKNMLNGGSVDVRAHQLLDEFLDANYLRKKLHKSNEEEQKVLSRYILDTLGDKVPFTDAKGNSMDWKDYLKRKFEAYQNPTEEQKEEILTEEILKATTKDASKSRLLREIIQTLSSLLQNESDKKALGDEKAKLQTFADLLNSIPRTYDGAKELGIQEVLKQLQEILQTKDLHGIDDIRKAIDDYCRKQTAQNEDALTNKAEEEKRAAKVEGENTTLNLLRATLKSLVEGEEVTIPESIKNSEIKKTLRETFEQWRKSKNVKDLEADKKKLLDNPALAEAHDKILTYKSATPIIKKLAELIEKSKKESETKAEEISRLNQALTDEQTSHKEDIENAARVLQQAKEDAAEEKKLALNEQKEQLEQEIQAEKDGRAADKQKWETTHSGDVEKIKSYHQQLLGMIQSTLQVVDDQLKSAYTHYDRSTEMGRLIDELIRNNDFYGLDEFMEKAQTIGAADETETKEALLGELKTLYSECLSIEAPTWIDVLTRLFCYTEVDFIASQFEQAGLDCQAVRRAFFAVETMLRCLDIPLEFPRLFKDKMQAGYDNNPVRSIDNYVSDLQAHIPDKDTVIDLYTTGFTLDGEKRRPQVSTN